MAADGWVQIRDKIQIDAALLSEVQWHIGSNDPVYLVAREITHEPGFVFGIVGNPVVLVCDRYDGNGGGIDTSGNDGTDGTPGSHGSDGHGNDPNQSRRRPGGPGTSGGNGTDGADARPITLVAQSATNGAGTQRSIGQDCERAA